MSKGPHSKVLGGKHKTIKGGRKNITVENVIKSRLGANTNCYICKEDVSSDPSTIVEFGIRKVGKKYKKVFSHATCEDSNES